MKLGVLLGDLAPSQLAYYLIRDINRHLASHPTDDVVVFYENLTPPCALPNFAIMPLVEAYGYDGVLLATDLSTAKISLAIPTSRSRFFFLNDLEWTREPKLPFRAYQEVYGHPSLHLLVRSESHADLVRSVWGRESEVVGNSPIGRMTQ